MCIVVDAPVLVPIFKASDPEHGRFLPVHDWVRSGAGKLVLGGSKYKEELASVSSVLPVLMELERRGRVVRVSDALVDREMMIVTGLESSKDFDDPHLIAIVRVTGCRLVCLRDNRAHRFLVKVKLYGGRARPRLFTNRKHKHLLCPANIAACCE